MVVKHSPDYYLASTKNIPVKSSISDQFNELSILKTDIDMDIDSVNESNKELMSQISVLESDNSYLMTAINNSADKRSGAIGMYHDSRDLYITKLLENYLLFISTGIVSYNIYISIIN